MERIWCVFWAIPALTIAITVSSNGNSPEIKMIGGMMVDTEKGFVPMEPKQQQENAITEKSNYEKSRALKLNNTKLSINERYRRLIPYMTFYYANDLSTPTTESYSTKDVQVEKLHLIEAPQSERSPRIIPQQSYDNVPRYHGNRLTKYNIASSNPGRLFKDSFPPHYIQKTPIYNIDGKYLNQYNNNRYVQKIKTKPEISYPTYQTRKPYLNLFQSDDNANLRYYLLNKEPVQQYKLIPYEQTPPVKVEPESVGRYENFQKPTFVKESVYTKPRPQHNFDTLYYKSPRKQPVFISENYFEKVPSSGQSLKVQPFLETGFKPILSDHVTQTTAIPVYMSTVTESPHMYYEGRKQVSLTETSSVSPDNTNTILRPAYYQYVVDQPVRQQVHPEYVSNAATLSDLFNSLQDTKSIPKPITRDNVGASIKTLLQVLNALRVAPLENEVVDAPVLSTPKPFLVTPKILEIPSKPVVEPVTDDVELSQEPYLAPVTPPSQHLDDFHYGRGSTQTFPLQVNSDDEGGTPGKPGVDYPILTTIPETSFDCKTQRYKGFFADPETKCQVWHYCDLNGGQASFLCPNGTIFSQAALTCDWWFNVRCASTTQLYVLNESLYKYILPHSPKFPEDYSGPLVDKYLTLKFKEMEEQFKKNKNKQAAEDKMDSSEEKDSGEVNTESTDNVELGSSEKSYLSEPNIVVETPGTSGNVERISE